MEEANLILRHIIKLLNESGFVDSNVRNDFVQSIQAIYNISLFMRWNNMEQTALKLLELAEKLKGTSYEELISTLDNSATLLRHIRLMVEHFNDSQIKKGYLTAL